MIEARDFVEAARQRDFHWYAGVPCSYLTPFINYVVQDASLHYLSMANEGDAVALIAGITLAGDPARPRRGIAMMQNSGLGNAVSPLTSLTWTFRLPQLLIVTWRGQPGVPDEPQHELMGGITPSLLDTMRIRWEVFPTDPSAIGGALDRAVAQMDDTGLPFALLMQKGSVAPYPLARDACAVPRRSMAPEVVGMGSPAVMASAAALKVSGAPKSPPALESPAALGVGSPAALGSPAVMASAAALKVAGAPKSPPAMGSPAALESSAVMASAAALKVSGAPKSPPALESPVALGVGSPARTEVRPSRRDTLRQVIARTPGESTAVLASTGFCGRELYATLDRPNQLYMVGSMGCVALLALGLALARPDLRVVALDGDGAALMRLGAFATIGAYGPPNLKHLLLDNAVHDSTGAQATVSPLIGFAQIAAACGYAAALETDDVGRIAAWLDSPPLLGPQFARVLIRPGTASDLPRPSLSPVEVSRRFMLHFRTGAGVH